MYFFRKAGFVLLAAAQLLALNSAKANAQRVPLVKVQLRSLDETFADLQFLSEAVGLGQVGQILMMTTQPYLRGLDGHRPVTLWVDGVGDEYRWLLVLPVGDLGLVSQSLTNVWGPSRQLSDGTLEFVGRRAFAVRPDASWLIVAESAEQLRSGIPLQQIVALSTSEEDLVFDLHPGDLPDGLRQRIFREIRRQAETQLQRINGEKASDRLRRTLIREAWDQLGQMVNDAEHLQLAWTADREAQKVQLKLQIEARPETLTFRRLGQFQIRPSPMATLLDRGGTITWNAVGELPAEDIPRLRRMIVAAADTIQDELASTHRFTQASTRQAVTTVFQGVLQTCADSLAGGRFDAAGVLSLGGQPLGGISGAAVANTDALRAALSTLAQQPPNAQASWRLSPNLSQQSGWTIHHLIIRTPHDVALKNAFGEEIHLWLGMTQQQLFVGLGPDGGERLERSRHTATQGAAVTVLPYHTQMTMLPALRFYQHVSQDPKAVKLLNAFGSEDRFTVQAMPIDRGVRFVVAADQGVLQAIGLALVPSFRKTDRTPTHANNP